MKKGISLVSLAIIIVIMAILAGIVVITGFGSAENATINTFALEILNIQNAVDEYRFRYEKYPTTTDITLNLNNIYPESTNQFESEVPVDNKILFKEIDLGLIGINDTEYGKYNTVDDIYVLSENTGKVYYLAGIMYEGKMYYTSTQELNDMIGNTQNVQVTSNDIKVYDVVFTPSDINKTNSPITVIVKVPKDAIVNNITATNLKSISEENMVGKYRQYTINSTSQDKTGNYEIVVNYTYNNVSKIAEYKVENYDNSLPTIEYTEKIEGDLKTVTVEINNNGSQIGMVKYEREIISDANYFKNYGKIVTNNQFVVEKNEYYTIFVKTLSGVTVMVNNIPDGWKPNVVDIVDTVPIPKGFTASSATGENTKNGGLVIYEGTEAVTNANVETAKRTRNQYVWVPVPKADFKTKFVRGAYNNTTYSNVLGEGEWEVVLDTTTNMPLATQDTNYMTANTLAEVQAMYESVKEYEGFYIARYEAGIDTQRTSNTTLVKGTSVYSMMGKIPYTYIPWGTSQSDDTNGAVEVARSMYPETNTNYGVLSTLTYGVQYDRILAWWLESGAKDGKGNTVTSLEDSTSYGNSYNHVIAVGDLNDDALVWNYTASITGSYVEKDSATLTYPKASGTYWALSTGALKVASVNNIYDMAGNMHEWTMEGCFNSDRVPREVLSRGGALCDVPSLYTYNIGFRSSLYIKMEEAK